MRGKELRYAPLPKPLFNQSIAGLTQILLTEGSQIRQPGSDPLGIPCQLCYKPAEELSGSLEGGSHDDGAAFKILRAIHPGGSLMQPGRDWLPLPHHAEPRRDGL